MDPAAEDLLSPDFTATSVNKSPKIESWKSYWSFCMISLKSLEKLENIEKLKSLIISISSAFQTISNPQLANLVIEYICEINFHTVSGNILCSLKENDILLTSTDAMEIAQSIYDIHANACLQNKKYCEHFCHTKHLVDVSIFFIIDQSFIYLVENKVIFNELINTIIFCIYNIVCYSEFSLYFAASLQLKKTLGYFIKKSGNSNNNNLKVNCTLTMAYLIDENNCNDKNFQSEINSTLTTMINLIQLFLHKTNDGFINKHSFIKFNLDELLEAFLIITVNDTICKSFITEHKGLDLLKKINSFSVDKKSCLIYTTKIFVNLVFNEKNRKLVQKSGDVKSFLKKLKSSLKESDKNYEPVTRTINASLFLLADMNNSYNGRKTNSITNKATEEKKDLFISFCWTNRDIVNLIHQSLENKKITCHLFGSLDEMQESTLDSMMSAIDNCDIVLLCMSEAYRVSQTCRMEVEYASKIKKTIFPLIVQDQFQPSGWLKELTKSQSYFDLSVKKSFTSKLTQLYASLYEILELAKKGRLDKRSTTSTTFTENVSIPSSECSQFCYGTLPTNVMNWTKLEVAQWLICSNLSPKKLKGFDGEMLCELVKLFNEAPNSYYSIISSTSNFNLLELMKLSKALRLLKI